MIASLMGIPDEELPALGRHGDAIGGVLDGMQSLCSLVLVAGFETTVNLIGKAVDALMHRPEVGRRLTEDPGLVNPIAEETVRWDSPVQATSRIAQADLELNRLAVPKGTLLLVLLAGAGSRGV